MEPNKQDVLWEFAKLPIEAQETFSELCEGFDDPEEMVHSILIGSCPHCDSDETVDGMDAGFPDEEIGDPTVGICSDCGTCWCLDCGAVLDTWPCSHWEDV